MTADLLTQLDTYFSDVEADQGPVSADHVAELADATPLASDPRRTWSATRVTAVAFALILVLVGGTALLSPFGGDSVAPADEPTRTTTPSASTVPPPSTSITTTIPPTLTETSFPLWTSVDGPEGATENGYLTTDNSGFVYVGLNGWYATSPDGVTWQRTELTNRLSRLDLLVYWDGILLGSSGGGASGSDGHPIVANPSFVNVTQGDGEVSTFQIDGDITATAIGRAGMVVLSVDNNLDHMIILGLTPEEEENLVSSGIEDGILTGTFADGSSRSVDLAEQGIDPQDINKTTAWFSERGIEWAAVAGQTPSIIQLMGSLEGFYGQSYGEDSAVFWFSADGTDWSQIGTGGSEGRLARAGDTVVWIELDGYEILSPDGTRPGASWDMPPQGSMPSGFGEDGILVLGLWDFQSEESVIRPSYASFGEPFVETEVPDAMAHADSWGMFLPSAAVVGDRYLLVLYEGDYEPSFWIRDFGGE